MTGVRVHVVTRPAFPVAVRGPWGGGEADICRMTPRCWGGRTGAALIAWGAA